MNRGDMPSAGPQGRAWPIEGILTTAVLRDVADLNLRFLELGLSLDPGLHPMAGWTDEVRQQIALADPVVLARMAACPFSLFEVDLAAWHAGRERDPGGVEDRAIAAGRAPPDAWLLGFRHVALFTVWRLADNAPLSARIVFGLSPGAELEFNEMCPTQVAALAMSPGVIRGRLPLQAGFWSMLRRAAAEGCALSLQRAHCFGFCLMEAHREGPWSEGPALPRGTPHR